MPYLRTSSRLLTGSGNVEISLLGSWYYRGGIVSSFLSLYSLIPDSSFGMIGSAHEIMSRWCIMYILFWFTPQHLESITFYVLRRPHPAHVLRSKGDL